MKTFLKEHKIATVVVSFIVILLGIIYFLTFPLLKKVISKADQIQEKIIDNDINKKKLEKIGEMEADFNYVEGKKDSLEVILDENEQVSFIKRLENLAAETGNSISMKVIEAPDPKKLTRAQIDAAKKRKEEDKTIKERLLYSKYFSLQVDLKGDYEKVLAFIHKLENATYYANTVSLDCKKIKEKIENKENGSTTQIGNIFAPTSSGGENNKTPQEKELVNCVLDLVVYTKK